MANKTLFKSAVNVPSADTHNAAGGKAYSLSDTEALAKFAVTGCLSDTFYASAKSQLGDVLDVAKRVAETEEGLNFIADCAVYSRQNGYMKDMPALLCAVLAAQKNPTAQAYLKATFPQVIDNGRMLRNFVQIVRSGVTGRKSFGTAVRGLIRGWLNERNDAQVFRASIGNDPSLADVIKMVHPRPENPVRDQLYRYLIGKDAPELSGLAREYRDFHEGASSTVPSVPFQMITSVELSKEQWKEVAQKMGWMATRMNLNTLLRHGVLDDAGMVQMVAKRLRDKELIKEARQFPYQILAAYLNVEKEVPQKIKKALHDAMEIACENVPEIEGDTYIFVDTSGSMQSPITGYRTSESKVRCVDVASLFGCAVLRQNPDSRLIPFDTSLYETRQTIDPSNTIMTNAAVLAQYGGYGTNCSLGLKYMNQRKVKAPNVIYISDNESWADFHGGSRWGNGTGMQAEWLKYRKKNPSAKMVLIDLVASSTSQVKDGSGVLQVAGFSDQVFNVVADFLNGNQQTFAERVQGSLDL